MERKEIARDLFLEGYACSQAIVLAFKDIVDLDEEQLKKISLPFGGGIGRLRLTCGAFSGMLIIISLLFANYEDVEENKIKTYEIVQELSRRFTLKLNTLSCEELLKQANLEIEKGGNPEARTNEYYKKRPCGKIVYTAAEILNDYLVEKEIIK